MVVACAILLRSVQTAVHSTIHLDHQHLIWVAEVWQRAGLRRVLSVEANHVTGYRVRQRYV